MRYVICFLVFISSVPDAFSGCRINIYVKNASPNSLELSMTTTGVRNKVGKWRDLYDGGWRPKGGIGGHFTTYKINVNETLSGEYRATFGCKSQRRYRFRYRCKGGKYKDSWFTDYRPSATGYTTKQSLTMRLKRCK